MFRPKLLFTSLAALALGACSPQDPQAVTSAAIAKSVILPTYTRWAEADKVPLFTAIPQCPAQDTESSQDFLTGRAQRRSLNIPPSSADCSQDGSHGVNRHHEL